MNKKNERQIRKLGIKTISDHEFIVREPRKWWKVLLGILGIPVVTGAVMMMLEEGGNPWIETAISLAGFLLMLFLFRRTWIFNPSQGIVKETAGIFFPMKSTEHQLSSCNGISIRYEERTTQINMYRSSTDVFMVCLEGEEERLQITEFENNFLKARKAAETIARYLEMDCIDYTEGTPVVRKPEQLDITLQKRLAGREIEIPKRKTYTHLDFVPEGNTWVFRYHARGDSSSDMWKKVIGAVLFGGVFFGGGVLMFSSGTSVYVATGFTLVGFWILFGGLSGILKRNWSRGEIVISPEAVTRTVRWPLGRERDSMPLDELEEIQSAGGRIMLVSDSAYFYLDECLDRKEREWLKAMLLHYLAKGPVLP